MEVKGKDSIGEELIDAILERPHPFKVQDRLFYVYPLTLGKTFLVQRIIKQIGVNAKNLQTDMNLEFLRVVKSSKAACCELMAFLTARNDYYDVFDFKATEERKDVFSQLSDEDLASFLVVALTADKTDVFIKHLGVDREQKDMRKVLKVKSKNDKNSFVFGGVSVYGTLIDPAMERYGLTKRQVMWEMDYVSLRLLLSDRVNSIYVTDAERKKIRVSRDRSRVDGDNKKEVLNFIQSQDWD